MSKLIFLTLTINFFFFVGLQLGNWESAIKDYEILRKETPEDEEVIRGLSETKEQLVKCQGHREMDQEVTD